MGRLIEIIEVDAPRIVERLNWYPSSSTTNPSTTAPLSIMMSIKRILYYQIYTIENNNNNNNQYFRCTCTQGQVI